MTVRRYAQERHHAGLVLWTCAAGRSIVSSVRWGYAVCLIAFHSWVRRRTDDDAGDVHVCLRCGKVLDAPDVDPRCQGMGGTGGVG